MKPIIVCDCETGGKDAERHALLGFGAVELVPDKLGVWSVGRTFECFVAPADGLEIDAAAMKVNGWPSADWQKAQWLPESVAARWFGGWLMLCGVQAPVAGWEMGGFCTEFDQGFLRALHRRTDSGFPMARHGGYDLRQAVKLEMLAASATGLNVPQSVPADVAAQWLGIEPEARPHLPLQGALWAAKGLALVLSHYSAAGAAATRVRGDARIVCAD